MRAEAAKTPGGDLASGAAMSVGEAVEAAVGQLRREAPLLGAGAPRSRATRARGTPPARKALTPAVVVGRRVTAVASCGAGSTLGPRRWWTGMRLATTSDRGGAARRGGRRSRLSRGGRPMTSSVRPRRRRRRRRGRSWTGGGGGGGEGLTLRTPLVDGSDGGIWRATSR